MRNWIELANESARPSPLEIANRVANQWMKMCTSGNWCPNMTARLQGAMLAAGYPAEALDCSDQVGAGHPYDFHYLVKLGDTTYDLTYRQFDPSTPIPYVRPYSEVAEEFRDIRPANTEGWWQTQVQMGARLMKGEDPDAYERSLDPDQYARMLAVNKDVLDHGSLQEALKATPRLPPLFWTPTVEGWQLVDADGKYYSEVIRFPVGCWYFRSITNKKNARTGMDYKLFTPSRKTYGTEEEAKRTAEKHMGIGPRPDRVVEALSVKHAGPIVPAMGTPVRDMVCGVEGWAFKVCGYARVCDRYEDSTSTYWPVDGSDGIPVKACGREEATFVCDHLGNYSQVRDLTMEREGKLHPFDESLNPKLARARMPELGEIIEDKEEETELVTGYFRKVRPGDQERMQRFLDRAGDVPTRMMSITVQDRVLVLPCTKDEAEWLECDGLYFKPSEIMSKGVVDDRLATQLRADWAKLLSNFD